MPTRLLREGILTSEAVNQLTESEELFYRRLMSVVDDYGRIEADPRILRASCYPLRVEAVTLPQIEAWVSAVAKGGLITAYEVDGKRYIEYSKLGKPRATKSRFPAPKLQTPTPENKRKQVKTDVPYSNSDSSSNSDSNAGAVTRALSAEEWREPDREALAHAIVRDCLPKHWFPSDVSLSRSFVMREIATAANPVAFDAAIRANHVLWTERVNQAHQSGSLPRSMANKPFEYWIKDGLYLQEPKFGASRLEQVAARGGVGRTVARLLASGGGE